MQIELTRTLVPEELGRVEDCAMCEESFEIGVAYPVLLVERRMDVGTLCPECVEFMGRHPSGKFPTKEDYQRSSFEEADRALGLY